MSKLFRDEVIRRHLSEVGVPLSLTPFWIRFYTFILLTCLVGGALVIAFGSYSRKARVYGFLYPDTGLARVIPAHAGRLVELKVAEGQHIGKDEVIAVVDVGTASIAGRTSDLIIRTLDARRVLLASEVARLASAHSADLERLDASASSLRSQISSAQKELNARGNLRRLLNNAFARNQSLERQGVYSPAQREKAEQDLVGTDIQIATLERAIATYSGDLEQVVAQRKGLPDRQLNEIAELQRQIAEIDQQINQAEEQRFVVLRATLSGVAAGLTASVGTSVDPSTPLLTIVPDGAALEAKLYVPSSAAGFVRQHARVLLRYEAFPYQKFGLQQATVVSISKTSVSARELPFPINSDEPLYLIQAKPKKQTITAYGREEVLQPGSKFQADLILEDRKLWEWAIDPLLAARQSL